MKRLIIALCAVFSLNLNACSQTPTSDSKIVSTAIANKQAILLDVRTPEEYASGHVSSAILAPHDNIAQTIAALAPNKQQTIYLHCKSGRRAGIAQQTLKDMGYTKVENLGGLSDLAQYGLIIDKP